MSWWYGKGGAPSQSQLQIIRAGFVDEPDIHSRLAEIYIN